MALVTQSSGDAFSTVMAATSAQAAPLPIVIPNSTGADQAAGQRQPSPGNAKSSNDGDAVRQSAGAALPAISLSRNPAQLLPTNTDQPTGSGSADDASQQPATHEKKNRDISITNDASIVVSQIVVPVAANAVAVPVALPVVPPAPQLAGPAETSGSVQHAAAATATSHDSVEPRAMLPIHIDASDLPSSNSAQQQSTSPEFATSQPETSAPVSTPAPTNASVLVASALPPVPATAIAQSIALPAAGAGSNVAQPKTSSSVSPAPGKASAGGSFKPASSGDAPSAGKKSESPRSTASTASSSATRDGNAAAEAHSPSTDTQTPSAGAGSAASNAPVVLPTAVHGHAPDPAPAHSTAAPPDLAAAQIGHMQREVPEGLPAAAISTASLMQSISQTEMRVGMRSAEFGDISIRTSVSQQQILAHISVDHGDLSNSLAAHLPSMQAKLEDGLGLRASIVVNQGGMSFSQERGQSSSGGYRSPAQTVQNVSAPDSRELDPMSLRMAVAASGDDCRLDIRA
jgi:hypothetical protein